MWLVVFLMRAFGYPQPAQVFFWMWKELLPHRRQMTCDLLCRLPLEVVPLVCREERAGGGCQAQGHRLETPRPQQQSRARGAALFERRRPPPSRRAAHAARGSGRV